ncbi:MAG: hypothetical protein LR011_05400 [Verrucomicrobia bacterium]|nr:hypothetical protein [Verrucomicrobiota bacterium]
MRTSQNWDAEIRRHTYTPIGDRVRKETPENLLFQGNIPDFFLFIISLKTTHSVAGKKPIDTQQLITII